MKVSDLRFYGMAFSDAEGSWPPEIKAEMKKKGMAVIMGGLGPLQKISFLFAYLKAKRRTKQLDLSALREKGMTNDGFLATQIDYLAAFSALSSVIGTDASVSLMKRVMDETARKALLLCLPEISDFQQFDDPFDAFREYLRATPAAASLAGCQESAFFEDSDQAIQMDITWCVWLELAKSMGIPEACIPNCYSDDLVFPEYFAALGIEYKRTQTLACGGCKCDFRFARMERQNQEVS